MKFGICGSEIVWWLFEITAVVSVVVEVVLGGIWMNYTKDSQWAEIYNYSKKNVIKATSVNQCDLDGTVYDFHSNNSSLQFVCQLPPTWPLVC